MTLLRRESQPISEGQTIIRSHYLYQPPAIAGVQLPATTVTKELVVVGCGVNYDANRGVGQPRWMPSNGALVVAGRAGVAYESTAGPLEFSLPVSADQALVVQKNGRAVACRFVGANPATAIKSDDRTARYVNVFADTDLVWKIGNGYLKESLILRSRTAPTEFSFLLESPDFAFLASDASQSTFSLSEIRATAQATKLAGPLLLAPATAKQSHQILVPAPFVVDAHGKRSSLSCFVTRTPTGALLYTMRIPAGFLTSRSLTYPLTIDPSYYNVPTDGTPIVYEASVTYYIESPISYYLGQSVRVEANAFVKFAPGSYLGFSGIASIRVEGTPYNYAYFTSGYDDSVGADTDGPGLPLPEGNPAAGNYTSALVMQGSGGNLIEYAKFAYADWAVQVVEGSGLTVENSIFRNNNGVFVYSLDNASYCQIQNCLFVGGSTAVRAETVPEYVGWIGLSIKSCTFDQNPTVAIHVVDSMYESGYEVKYCVFANAEYGIVHESQDPNQSPTFSIDRNGLYNVSTFVYPDTINPGNYIEDESWPFVSNANGSCYLRDGSPFRDYGDCPAGGLSGKTTTALSAGRTTSGTVGSQTWSLYSGRGDNGLLNLGYHYDPVDWIVAGEVSVYGTLHVVPGVTVATSGVTVMTIMGPVPWLAGLTVQSNGNLDMRGTGSQPIRFSSVFACGDRIGRPNPPGGDGLLWLGIATDGSGDRTFQYCTIENAFIGLYLKGSANPIEHCRLGSCTDGIVTTAAIAGTIRNCLFRDIGNSAIKSASNAPLTVLNCTITSAEVGVNFASATTGNVVRNSILVNSRRLGISKHASAGVTENHNCFYGNVDNANFPLQSPPDDTYGDPRFVNRDAPDLYARFYLDQDLSPCLDAGNTNDLPFMSTTPSRWPDFGRVDIGYHYPGALIEPSGGYAEIPNWASGTTLFYPQSLQLNDGTILCSVHDGLSARLFESDNYGVSWSELYNLRIAVADIPATHPGHRDATSSVVNSRHLIQLHNQWQNTSATLSDGTVLMAVHYEEDWDTSTAGLKYIHSIEIFSMDPATTNPTWTWRCTAHLDDHDYWSDPTPDHIRGVCEPFLLEKANGEILCFFTRGSGQRDNSWDDEPGYIAAKISKSSGASWKGEGESTTETAMPITVAAMYDPNGAPGSVCGQTWLHFGMAYAVEFPDGKIYAVFEAGNLPGIRSGISADGGHSWPTAYPYGYLAQVVYDPAGDRVAGCPNIVRLTDGRLVCAFTTNEDWTNPVTGGDWWAKSDVKAITSTNWGEIWSPSFVVASQRTLPSPRQSSWSGLIRLRDESLLCTFNDGPAGLFHDPVDNRDKAKIEEAKSTIINYSLGVDTPLIEDHFDQLNLDWTPFVWGLLGTWEMTTAGVHGNVFKGTALSIYEPSEAFRGDAVWTDYRVQADVKLDSSPSSGGLLLRVSTDSWYGDGFYECYVTTRGLLRIGFRYLVTYPVTYWAWQDLGSWGPVSNPSEWHTIRVDAVGSTFNCYLDGFLRISTSSSYYSEGMVGLWVNEGSACFDNVTVTDLRQ